MPVSTMRPSREPAATDYRFQCFFRSERVVRTARLATRVDVKRDGHSVPGRVAIPLRVLRTSRCCWADTVDYSGRVWIRQVRCRQGGPHDSALLVRSLSEGEATTVSCDCEFPENPTKNRRDQK